MRARWAGGAAAGAAAAYGAALVAVEARGGQAALRPYAAELVGPVLLTGVNTWVSASALLVAGVLWLAVTALPAAGARVRPYAAAQGALLIGLAVDDTFALHEQVGGALPGGELAVFAAVGAAQVALLAARRDVAAPDRRSGGLLALGGALAAAMLAIDALAPADAALRLAAEEVAKAWAGLALCAWAAVRFTALARADRPG